MQSTRFFKLLVGITLAALALGGFAACNRGPLGGRADGVVGAGASQRSRVPDSGTQAPEPGGNEPVIGGCLTEWETCGVGQAGPCCAPLACTDFNSSLRSEVCCAPLGTACDPDDPYTCCTMHCDVETRKCVRASAGSYCVHSDQCISARCVDRGPSGRTCD